MKKRLIILALLAISYLASYAQTDYVQFEVLYIKPKMDKLDLFRKAVGAHNKKYHSKAPYQVRVYSVDSGPNAGSYVWVMGPTTMTQMDNAPGAGEHILDWEKNINPLCESVGETMYWRMVKDVSYEAEGSTSFTHSRLRISQIYPGKMARFTEQLKKVGEVYKKKKYNASFSMATRFGASNGPNVVSFTDFGKWAAWDEVQDFQKDFNEIHGPGSYDRFIEEIDLCLDRSMSYDEFQDLVPEMGS